MQCPNCQNIWPDEFKFCPRCGLSFDDANQNLDAVKINAPVASNGSIASGGHVIIARDGSKVIIGDVSEEELTTEGSPSLGKYLSYLISRNRYVQLQGIRSGGKVVSIELERIYINLRATNKKVVEYTEQPIDTGDSLTSSDSEYNHSSKSETVIGSIADAINSNRRLVILGDPGSGKTTLISYIGLLYAKDLANRTNHAQKYLGVDEHGYIPILIPLRRLGAYLKTHHGIDDGTEGHGILLKYFFEMLAGERVKLPPNFFDSYLNSGKAVILLDGLDEVANLELRRRVSRLVEAFVSVYPDCRYIVSSRVIGYSGTSRLGENFNSTTILDFTLDDVEKFIKNWHLAIAIGQMGAEETVEDFAELQTKQLMSAVESNERIRELVINPLMLTVIAMVHRDRVKLPDRRAELYDEAINVLLGKWDEAKGVQHLSILTDRPFDASDRKLMLLEIAFWMHERDLKEIEGHDLTRVLISRFNKLLNNESSVERAVENFIAIIKERTGLISEHGLGVYRFSHLTFQEYLAALAVAGKDDYIEYTISKTHDPWWREVILLEAGYLSSWSSQKATRLIKSIAELKEEIEPYHNLVLAAECLQDIGAGRIDSRIESEVQSRLRKDLSLSIIEEINQKKQLSKARNIFRITRRKEEINISSLTRDIVARKSIAMNALVKAGAGFWTKPYGEPEWVPIPKGEFSMGAGEQTHRVYVEDFSISKALITNFQYHLFTKIKGYPSPPHWENGRPPKNKESHPVVNVTFQDALNYCEWLSSVTGKVIKLPTEAEWEKAARGDSDERAYPWGNVFDPIRCNNEELGIGDTTPVGIFSEGASPYGTLDMAGNVWEWTRSLCSPYPYNSADGREIILDGNMPVLRGGAFVYYVRLLRCSARYCNIPQPMSNYYGFRVVCIK